MEGRRDERDNLAESFANTVGHRCTNFVFGNTDALGQLLSWEESFERKAST